MALELRPKKSKPGQAQKWVARFQIPTGKRNKAGKLLYKNHAETIGERGKMTKTQAEDIHDQLKRKMKGGYLIDSPPLQEFAAEFIKHKKEVDNLRSYDRYIQSIKPLLSFFGYTILLSEISPKRIDEYKAHRLKTVKSSTVNRDLSCLSSMINLAKKWNNFKGDNPVTKAGSLKEIREELVPVNVEEEVQFLDALHDKVSWICEFALNTGMRIEEILQLKEKAIQFNEIENMYFAKLEATEQKGKRYRDVPLNNRAVELIEMARSFKKKNNYKALEIFLSTSGHRYAGHDSIRKVTIKTCEKIGLRRINPHLLRHTFITRLIEKGADPISVQEIVGHTDIKTLLKYTHLRSSKFNAVTLLNNPQNKAKSVV